MTASVTVCCLCIKSYPILEGIYEMDDHEQKYYEKLKTCFPNELWYKDYKICKNCIDHLDLAYKFITICIKNEKIRKQMYGKFKGPYLCNECSKSYKSELILKKHYTIVHSSVTVDKKENNCLSTENTCTIKPEEAKEETILDVEIMMKNEDESSNIFQDTDNEPNGWEDEDNENIEDIIVKKKPSTFSNTPIKQPQSKLKQRPNVLTQNKIGQWKCEECSVVFKQEKYLKKHVWSKHKFQRVFNCDQCDSTYKYRNSLEIHKRVHTGERPFVCSFCGKGFRSGQELNVHAKLHQPENNYQCPLCDKAFKTAGNLRKHKICVHTDSEEYKYKCNQCGHKFPFKGHLDLHLKRHAGIKKLPCHICGKNFLLKSDVDFHIRRTHKNEQLANCEVCNKEFKTAHGLRKHLKSAHNLGNYKGSLVQVKKLLCPYCPKMFPYSSKLQRHILIHTGEKPFKCDICAKGFRDKTDLKTHLKNAHQILQDSVDVI